MITQADLKRYRALQQKKARGEHRRFLVQGRKVVVELLASRLQTEVLLASEEAAAFVRPHAGKVPVQILAGHELDKIGTFEKGNELIAIVAEPEPIGYRAPRQDEVMLALDGVRDPRNLGSLLRIADWFGHTRVLLSHECMELYNPKVVQSTMGSLFRVEARRCNLAEELARATRDGASVYCADMGGAPIFEAQLQRPAIVVLGSESHGLSSSFGGRAVLSIPRLGGAESLNVAMAATAFCTEFARRAWNVSA